MTGPSIIFRADASHRLGVGHVARMCSVIEEAGPAGVEPIVMFGGDPALAAFAKSRGVTADVRAWTTAELLAAALRPGVRAVVLDGPALAGELVPVLAERRIRTVVIDDSGSCPRGADAVVNHNFHAPELAGNYAGARVCLLGRAYHMLGRAIRDRPHGACQPVDGARLRVVVTFGGSDPVGATARTLRLLPAGRALDIVALAGPGFRDDAALHAAAAEATAAGHTVEIVRDPVDPATAFIAADAAICAAGGTLGELAYLGCPALGFAIVPDQIAGARAQSYCGLIAGGYTWAEIDDDTVRALLRMFLLDDRSRRDHRRRALATVDGAGPRRIVREALV